jgi:anti-sigma regulatory factor (Ser/Thr protein kinase)
VQTAISPEITTSTSASFAAEPPSATAARRFVTGIIGPLVRRDVTEVAALLTTELATNSVLHARTDIDVEVSVSALQVRVEVSDAHPSLPVRIRPEDHSTFGRGLLLVDELSDDWGVAPHGTGKGVWFALDR